MPNSTGDAGGSKASLSAPIGISGGHSFRQFGQDGGGGPRRAVAGGALGTEFFNRTGTTRAAGALPLAQLLASLLGGFAAGVSAAADWRKDAVQSGVALVMRGLLQTMYAYCEGPPSTPQVEAE